MFIESSLRNKPLCYPNPKFLMKRHSGEIHLRIHIVQTDLCGFFPFGSNSFLYFFPQIIWKFVESIPLFFFCLFPCTVLRVQSINHTMLQANEWWVSHVCPLAKETSFTEAQLDKSHLSSLKIL